MTDREKLIDTLARLIDEAPPEMGWAPAPGHIAAAGRILAAGWRLISSEGEAFDDLLEQLEDGVPACGMHEDGDTELFRIEDANDTMAEAATALRALRAEVERLRGRSYALAVAIMGGEDVPGLADGTSTDALVAQARENERRHMQCIDREMRLTRERDEAREALQALVDEYVDYQIINNLGDPEKQHNIRRARAALGRLSAEAAATATAPAQEGQADG